MKQDFDIPEQCDTFYVFLEATSDDRQKFRNGYSHSELEWEAFQAGWNAAKQHFKVADA